ncbi:proteoglycan 4 isoform X1 [Cydia pomonella]|uniref:proteoglycan 4 isoform X1 n=1 Tax=Cydia pomonella TaxID=82600 RepID=UPI002ADDFF3F|nr:proteoglycan 4 isoform X1 [Cydia pomonella]
MSAPTESAASLSACACTNISLMQLFHELKQKFPSVPDHVVSSTIELYCHDKQACETQLHSEVKASLTHAYHASSSAAARHHEHKLSTPAKCRNQPIFKHEAPKLTAINAVTCQAPQTAVLSTCITDENENNKVNTDANQNVVEPKAFIKEENVNNSSPVTVINIDNCCAKYSAESPSDLELSNETPKEQASTPQSNPPEPESTNYRILKSNKVRCNLHEKLEKGKGKKTINKEEPKVTINKEEPKGKEGTLETDSPPPSELVQEKPKRPNTLDFIKPNPDIAFKPHVESEPCRSVSPAPPKQEPPKEPTPGTYRPERGFSERPDRFPVNVSVNVNCHMDYGYDPWLEDFHSPRPITSVNLTVCTPTSNMASPVRDREDDFEGHVLVTVSPSTARAPPRRRAPPPPAAAATQERLEPRPTRAAPAPPESSHVPDRSLIERQKERLGRLARALAQERTRLAQLTREARVLSAPLPTPAQRQQLRDDVQRLRAQCDHLTKRVELSAPSLEQEESDNFYNNIYTGQRPPASWKCHMCTFLNHPLLDKCEECDMPRIVIGTSPALTLDSGFGSFRDKTRNRDQNITDAMDNLRC